MKLNDSACSLPGEGRPAFAVAGLLLILCLLCSGCATAAQRERGLSNKDARREAAAVGMWAALGHLIFGADEKTDAPAGQ